MIYVQPQHVELPRQKQGGAKAAMRANHLNHSQQLYIGQNLHTDPQGPSNMNYQHQPELHPLVTQMADKGGYQYGNESSVLTYEKEASSSMSSVQFDDEAFW